MTEMIIARQTGATQEERYDLFSGLLEASGDEKEAALRLSDDELISGSLFAWTLPKDADLAQRQHLHLLDWYVLHFVVPQLSLICFVCVAGHEVRSPSSTKDRIDHVSSPQTTSNTLAFAFGLLAIYQEEQQRLYEHIMGICQGRVPVRRLPSIIFLAVLTLGQQTYDEMGKFTRVLAYVRERRSGSSC